MRFSNLMSHFPHLVLCREEQVLSDDTFADRLLHGGGVEASVGEKKAVLKALRWPPVGLYTRLAFAPEHEREATLSHFPLSDDELLDRLRAIREQHLVVMVARGTRVRQWREGSDAFFISATAPLRPEQSELSATVEFRAENWDTGRRVPLGGLLPPGDYLLEGIGLWDGPLFQRACEAVQSLPFDRAYMTALAVVYSALGEPFLEDGRLRPRIRGTPLPRFITFPRIGSAVWAAAEREAIRTRDGSTQAVLWRLLAETFVEVVRELRIDFSKPHLSDRIRVPRPKADKHWGIRVELALVLAEATGRRLGSIRQLRWEDIDFQRATIRWRAEADKKGREWIVPIPPHLLEELKQFRRRLGAVGGWLFAAERNSDRPMDRHLFDRWLNVAEGAAKLPKLEGGLWHPYRRKWATERKGHSLKDVAAAGGWQDTETLLKCYQQPDNETLLAVMSEERKLRELVSGA